MCFCGISVTIGGKQIMIEEVDQEYPGFDGDSETGEKDYYSEIKKIRDYLFSEANRAIKSL
jgi:DNA-binding ferritin-like protein (Dps family)